MGVKTLISQLQDFDEVFILNKPDSFEDSFSSLNFSESLILTSCVDCAMVFTKNKTDFVTQMLTLFPRLQDHSVIWVLYPKETGTRELANLHTEFDWDFLGDYRLQPLRLLRVDSLWNAIKLKKIIQN